MTESVSLQRIYDKLNCLKDRLDNIEERLVPEVKINAKKSIELKRIRKEILLKVAALSFLPKKRKVQVAKRKETVFLSELT